MEQHLVLDSYVTKTGLLIQVRRLTPEDAPYLVDLFEHMSSESRYNRFLQSADHVDIERIWSEAEQIVHLAVGQNLGWIAFADLPEQKSAPVAAARYVMIAPTQAEMAISVRDDMQHMGIGQHLLQLLTNRAAEEGIEQLVGTVQNSNEAMWAILKKLGRRLERLSEGSSSMAILHLNEPLDGNPNGAAESRLPEADAIR